jgi:hypothetical protein
LAATSFEPVRREAAPRMGVRLSAASGTARSSEETPDCSLQRAMTRSGPAAKVSCEDEQLDKNAAQLRYVCNQLEKGLDKLIAKEPDVPLNSFEHGCIRATTWYGRLSPEDRPEVDEMMKRLSDSLKNKCISLKMKKMKKCNLAMKEMTAEQRGVFQMMAVQFAMKKNGLVDCDGVLASDSDAVYLSSTHAKGAAIIDPQYHLGAGEEGSRKKSLL